MKKHQKGEICKICFKMTPKIRKLAQNTMKLAYKHKKKRNSAIIETLKSMQYPKKLNE